MRLSSFRKLFPRQFPSSRPNHRPARPARSSSPLHVEPLETRLAPACTVGLNAGRLIITGDAAADGITVDQPDPNVRVNCNGQEWLFATASVNFLEVNAGGGDDTITTDVAKTGSLRGAAGSDTVNVRRFGIYVYTESAGDVINVGSADNTLDGFVGTVHINTNTPPGGGTLNINDQASNTGQYYSIGGEGFIGRGNQLIIIYQNLNSIVFNTGSGNDTVYVGGICGCAPVTFNTGNGDDTIRVQPVDLFGDDIRGPITVNAGAGNDSLNLIYNTHQAQFRTTYYLTATTVQRGHGPLITFNTIENLTIQAGRADDDYLVVLGTPAGGRVTFDGGGGSDSVVGADVPNVWQITGHDAGTYSGTGLGGPVQFVAVENLWGGANMDEFVFADGEDVTGYVGGGGSGPNTLDYSAWTTGVLVDLNNGVAGGTVGVFNIDNVIGGAGPDYFHGDGADNLLVGNGGDDILVGDAGNDALLGGPGRDMLFGGVGADQLLGADGEDLLIDGWTSYDYDVFALTVIWDEWTRTDVDYNGRIANLRYLLNADNVFSDGDVDTLSGGADLDWFWASPFDLLDRESGEMRN